MTLAPIITIPGVDGSDEAHWHTQREKSDATLSRFPPTSWSHPEFETGLTRLAAPPRQLTAPPLLVAHCLGTLAAAEWLRRSPRPAAGAVRIQCQTRMDLGWLKASAWCQPPSPWQAWC
jgi:predicted alpha/beta hydrolase family esterase